VFVIVVGGSPSGDVCMIRVAFTVVWSISIAFENNVERQANSNHRFILLPDILIAMPLYSSSLSFSSLRSYSNLRQSGISFKLGLEAVNDTFLQYLHHQILRSCLRTLGSCLLSIN